MNILAVIIITVLLLLIAGIVIIAFMVPLKTYFKALTSNAHVPMKVLAGMKMRKIDYDEIINNYIVAKKSNLDLSLEELEAHYLAKGNIYKLVNALILARTLNVPLTKEMAKGYDLAKRDLMEMIRTSITPKLIKTPVVSAVSRDGMELKATATLTLKTLIDSDSNSVTEDTIITRTTEGIVAFIGRANDYHQVLASPIEMSKFLMSMDVGKNSRFKVVSIDIDSVSIGQNIAANLRVSEAETQAKISKAQSEQRRIAAQIKEQEMKAKTQEMKAVLLASESEVHKAMAKAFRDGQMGVLDYYKLQNVMADTNLRNSLSGKNGDNDDEDDDDNFDPFSRFGSGNPFRGGSSSRGGTQVIPDKMANRMR